MTRLTVLWMQLDEVHRCLDELNPAALTLRKVYHGHPVKDHDLPLERARRLASEACLEMGRRLPDVTGGLGKLPQSVVRRMKEKVVGSLEAFAGQLEESGRRLGDGSLPIGAEDLERFEQVLWAVCDVSGRLFSDLMGR